jgi:DNA-binding NarL/FixJ family response regulator
MTTPAEPIRVLIVDDHPLLRGGLAAVLGSEPGMAVAGEATNGLEAIDRHRALKPDVTLMDLQMPTMNGIDATRAIRSEFPHARIIVLTTYDGDVLALRAIKAGAAGYLLKGLLRRDLMDTIRAVHAGKRYVPPKIAAGLAEHYGDDLLSDREVDVLQLVAAGRSNKRIADELSISEETVKSHMKKILGKLSAKDRTHAVTIGLKRGILAP